MSWLARHCCRPPAPQARRREPSGVAHTGPTIERLLVAARARQGWRTRPPSDSVQLSFGRPLQRVATELTQLSARRTH